MQKSALIFVSIALIFGVGSAFLHASDLLHIFKKPTTLTSQEAHALLSGLFEGLDIQPKNDFAQSLNETHLRWAKIIEDSIVLLGRKDLQSVHEAMRHFSYVLLAIREQLRGTPLFAENDIFLDTLSTLLTSTSRLSKRNNTLLLNNMDVTVEVEKLLGANNRRNFRVVGSTLGALAYRQYFENTPAANARLAEAINNSTSSWVADSNQNVFGNISTSQFRTRLGAKRKLSPKAYFSAMKKSSPKANPAPDAFDSREKWPECIKPIRNQQKCGSCWAFAGAEALTDRFCIHSDKKITDVLSPQYMVSCDPYNFGCNGGYLDHEWEFLELQGTVTDSCWPYESGDGKVPPCLSFTECKDKQPMKFYKAILGSSRGQMEIDDIQNEILTNGPVETAFLVMEDFKQYKSGIYEYKQGKFLGGHAVKSIGWGVENGKKYWICANSWSETWGENGFFKIAFNNVGIDDEVIAGIPDLIRQ